MEHRWGRRHQIKEVVCVLHEGRTGTGRIHDISVSGAWMGSSLPVQLLTQVRVGFPGRVAGTTIDWVPTAPLCAEPSTVSPWSGTTSVTRPSNHS